MILIPVLYFYDCSFSISAELRSGGSLDEQPTDVAHAACEGICGLSVQSRGGAIFIALGTKQEGIKLIAFQNHKLQEVCSVS